MSSLWTETGALDVSAIAGVLRQHNAELRDASGYEMCTCGRLVEDWDLHLADAIVAVAEVQGPPYLVCRRCCGYGVLVSEQAGPRPCPDCSAPVTGSVGPGEDGTVTP